MLRQNWKVQSVSMVVAVVSLQGKLLSLSLSLPFTSFVIWINCLKLLSEATRIKIMIQKQLTYFNAPLRNVLLTNAVSLESIYNFGAAMIDTGRIQSKVDWAWQLLQPAVHQLLEKTYVPAGLNLNLTRVGFELNVRGVSAQMSAQFSIMV